MTTSQSAGNIGDYFIVSPSLKYTQRISQYSFIQSNLVYQASSHNLDGSEKLSLSGPYAVRAYSNEVSGVDEGLLASFEMISMMPYVDNLSFKIFYDYANGQIQKHSLKKHFITLQGVGVGGDYSIDKLQLSAVYALPIGHTDQGSGKPQFWMTASMLF